MGRPYNPKHQRKLQRKKDKAAYDGAREDLSIWKRRALEAEEKVRKYDQRIVDIGVIAMTPVTTPQPLKRLSDADIEAMIYEHTKFNVNIHEDGETVIHIKNLANAIMDKMEN